MRKSYFYLVISFVLFAASFVSTPAFLESAVSASSDAQPVKLSEEELVSTVRPAVVRVVEHIEGDVSIIPFKINLKDFSVRSIPGEKPLKMPVNLDITGSGFVVNPEGYILANSRVVSDVSAKIEIVQPIINLILAGELSSMSDAEEKKMNSERTKEEGVAFGRKILDYVITQSTFNLARNIVVLDPTATGETLRELTETGFPVDVVSVNDNWYKDDKDVAVLKITEKNLPSLRLGGGDTLSLGDQVYVFGFPSNTELSGNNLLESTFTKGVLNEFRNSQNTDFRIFQTDAKISANSSGGPLFDADGQVAGLVTLETSSVDRSKSDTIALAVPAEIAKTILSDSFIINDEGIYAKHLKAGLLLMRDKRCKNAIAEFELAKNVNQKFGVARYVDPYIEKCNNLISSGFSIDSKWDEFMVKVRSLGMLAWALFAAGIFLLIILCIGIFILIKRLKNDQGGLPQLERAIPHQNGSATASISPQSPFTAIVSQEKNIYGGQEEAGKGSNGIIEKKDIPATTPLSDPNVMSTRTVTPAGDPRLPNEALLKYIKQARQAGLTFQAIENELKGVGWSDDEISRALAVPQQ